MVLRQAAIRAIGVLIAVLALSATFSASAGAISTSSYCGWQVGPNSPCSDSRSGYLIANTASYSGAGTVSVCERVIAAEGGQTLSRRCDNNIAGSGTDLNGYGSVWKTATVGNDSPYRHTINGLAYYP